MPAELSMSQPAMTGPSVVNVTYIGGGGAQADDGRMPGGVAPPPVASSHLQFMEGVHNKREILEPSKATTLVVRGEEAMEEQQREEKAPEQFISMAELTANRMSEAGTLCMCWSFGNC